MRELFGWQMVGDALKIGSWILAYLMLGKAMVKLFILTEIFFSISFVMLSYLFVQYIGLKGTALAHAANYFIYWFFLALVMYKRFRVF
mgnify:FL=1